MIFVSTDILNPYKREIVSQDSYKTLIDFLQDKYPNGFTKPIDVSINGIEIAVMDYDVSLSEKDVIVLLDRTALAVGVISSSWFITALANLAISVTLSYVANKLFAPDSAESQGQTSSVYNLNSAQNSASFGSPIPIIYGKVRMYPSMVVQPYYKFEDDIEYLYHVLCIGQGTNTTDAIQIGDDVFSSTEDLEWKLLYQSDFYNIPSNAYGIHVTKTLSNPSNMEIEVGDGESEKYTISAEAQYLEFDYMYPNGLIYYESDGGTTAIKTEFKAYLYNSSSTLVDTITFYKNVSNVNAIQETHRIDVSAYDEPVYISFEKTLNAASSWYVTNTFIKRVKEIHPNEDFTNLYGDITLLAVKIKATNAVSSAGQVKVNGYFERTDVGNLMHEVLTDLYTNTTYGGGLSSDDLDFPVTTEMVDCAYESSITLFDAMRKPALAQGYSLYLAGMDVILKKDGVNTVTSGMYNEMNILRNSFKAQYLFKEEYPAYDGFECSYIVGEGWTPQTALYPSTSIRPQKVDLFGVVDWGAENPFEILVTSSAEPYYSVTGGTADTTNNGDGTWTIIGTTGISHFAFTTSARNNIIEVHCISADSLTSMYSFCSSCYNLRTITFDSHYITSGVTNFQAAFSSCYDLTSFPVINTASGTTFQSAWSRNRSLTSFPVLNTSNGTNFQAAWYDCRLLESFPTLDMSKATTLYQTWYDCYSLVLFPAISFGNVTIFEYAWHGCYGLTSMQFTDTSKGDYFRYAFDGCTSLVCMAEIDTSGEISTTLMFQYCSLLTAPDSATQSLIKGGLNWTNSGSCP